MIFLLFPHTVLSVAPSSNSGLHGAWNVRTFSPKRDFFKKKKLRNETSCKALETYSLDPVS